jgi:hypothetical protein
MKREKDMERNLNLALAVQVRRSGREVMVTQQCEYA